MDHKRQPTEALFPLIAIGDLLFWSWETPLVAIKSIMSIGTIDHYKILFFLFLNLFSPPKKYKVTSPSEIYSEKG